MKKKILLLLICVVSIIGCSAGSNNKMNVEAKASDSSESSFFKGKKVLIAYFSWGGTTERMAKEIQNVTGGDLFKIVPEKSYPTDYTECTEVAKVERDKDLRPAISGKVVNFDEYDVVFIGCPVWWHTAPMIISTFVESYDFKGKAVVPFCTYAATYRDETLQKIVDLTPNSKHLKGLGTTGDTDEVKAWIESIGK
ncbi:MAG: flavodoxin [Prevotellaceae bacterium]|nr:flavodoxin [Prevotellaceae bacterium]